jgi:uncharacterized membrane protein
VAAEARTDHALERLVFFSDAVFAIAITLLVLEIDVPHLPSSASDAAFVNELAKLIPSFVGYIISFAVIGAFWANHHRAFACARVYGDQVLRWNMALLGMIGLMPWFTAFMSSNIRGRLPTIVYCAALTVTGLLNLRVVHLATGAAMAGEAAGGEAAVYVRRRSLAVVLGAAAALLLGFFLHPNAQLGLLSIPLWRRLLARRPAAVRQES